MLEVRIGGGSCLVAMVVVGCSGGSSGLSRWYCGIGMDRWMEMVSGSVVVVMVVGYGDRSGCGEDVVMLVVTILGCGDGVRYVDFR